MRTRSPESRERARAYWRRNGAARARAYAAAARRDGICTLCRKRPPIAGFDNCQECTQFAARSCRGFARLAASLLRQRESQKNGNAHSLCACAGVDYTHRVITERNEE